MPNTTWLITGASRGLGLETARQLLQTPTNTVFGTCRSPSTATFKPSALSNMMATNALGPALVSRYLLPAIERSDRRVIMNMTSRLASIGSDYGTIDACYCMSKVALNMLTYKQAREHPDLIPIVLEPGWVKTDMGGPCAEIEPAESVAGTLKVLRSLTKESAGKFFSYKGNEVLW